MTSSASSEPDASEPASATDPAAPRVGPPDPVWVYPLSRLFLWALAIGLALYFFEAFTFIVLTFLAAGTLASLLSPAANRIPGPRWLRGLIAAAVFALMVIALLVGAGWALLEPVERQIRQLPQIAEAANRTLHVWSERLGLEDPVTLTQIRDQALGMLTGGESGEMLSAAMGRVSATAVALLLLLFGALYMLAQSGDNILKALERMTPGRERAIRGTVDDMSRGLRWWLLGTMISGVVVGTLNVIGYTIIGLEFAVPLAILAGLAEFIPYFGPVAAGVLALMIAATQDTTQVIGVVVIYAIVQTLEANLLVPLVMRQALHMPPLVTLFSVVLWGRVFGPAGLLLAIPINLTIWTMIDRFYIRAGQLRDPPAHHGPDAGTPPRPQPSEVD